MSSSIFNSQTPTLIAGPCSAETETQVLETARALALIPEVKVFRAGIWKPRTRPGAFEGMGEEALKWLQKVKAETGLLTAVEAGNPEHVEELLKHGIDIIWIGARTTVNPFAVQEIADAVKGNNVHVWVKNPINPDLKLWMGAIERIEKAGIENVVAIHRGFQVYENSVYRYPPKWDIPISLMSERPDLKIVCDPSHITGKRDMLLSVSQKAMDLGFDGLMIETHPNPDQAWSDAAQQITPQTLQQLLAQLQIRDRNIEGVGFTNELESLRNMVDSLDEELLEIIAKRMDLIAKIGSYKKQHNITVFQPERWLEIKKSRANFGENLKLNPEFVLNILTEIHNESIRFQTEIIYPEINQNNEH
ncbi:MAG TPA: chorismate mutase [Bacteroidia bacterium]